eukprot:6210710-Pleurochrysis_carterae.AAC.2
MRGGSLNTIAASAPETISNAYSCFSPPLLPAKLLKWGDVPPSILWLQVGDEFMKNLGDAERYWGQPDAEA